MKRCILILMMTLVAFGAWAQDLSTFKTGFESFAVDMAATLSYNATVGNNWSDAYIGQFPHFGAGVALGATAVPADSLKPLFTAMGKPLPAELQQYGLPIPAAAVSAKLGGLFLPFDLGVKAMILPAQATAALSSQGIAADYKLIGGNVRVALLKEKGLMPDLSIGGGYNRLVGTMSMDAGIPTQTYLFTPPSNPEHSLEVRDPTIALDWTTDSFDFSAQVSKKILFLRPFLGVGYSLGKSAVNGGLKADMYYDDNTGDATPAHLITAGELQDIKDQLAAAGQPVPDISADGFMFAAENNEPVLRLYGGVSLNILFLNLDLQGIYVPKTKSLGANAMIRVQF